MVILAYEIRYKERKIQKDTKVKVISYINFISLINKTLFNSNNLVYKKHGKILRLEYGYIFNIRIICMLCYQNSKIYISRGKT